MWLFELFRISYPHPRPNPRPQRHLLTLTIAFVHARVRVHHPPTKRQRKHKTPHTAGIRGEGQGKALRGHGGQARPSKGKGIQRKGANFAHAKIQLKIGAGGVRTERIVPSFICRLHVRAAPCAHSRVLSLCHRG